MRRLIFTGVALMMMGCATSNGGMSEGDLVALEARIEALESSQQRHKTKMQSLEKRLTQLEEMVTLLSRRTSIDTREVVRIEPETSRGSSTHVQDVETGVEGDDVYEEIVISEDKKRAYFGNSRSNRSATTPTTLKAYENVTDEKLPSAEKTKAQSESTLEPMTFYREGIDLYRQGQFSESRTRFEKFLATKPEESYIDNALYWIGECFYGEGLYHEAAGYFHRIVQEYPTANKVPDALLKVSLTYQKLGKTDSAREMLRYLMEAFPGTEAARLGKEKYEALTQP